MTLFFTDPITGLSTPTRIGPFPADQHVLDVVTLLPNGVMLRNPGDGALLLATPDGNLGPHPFMPQTPQELVTIEWVLSPDGGSILWVEVFAAENAWVSNLYTADVRGGDLQQLPAPPLTEVEPFRRARPVALSDDRSRVFIDVAAPVARPASDDYFRTYEDLHVYRAETETYQQISGEPTCACGAGVAPNTGAILRVEPSDADLALRWLSADAVGSGQRIAPAGLAADQAGDFFWPGLSAFYTQAIRSADGPTFALLRLSPSAGTQQVLIEPSPTRYVPYRLLDDGESLLLLDFYNGGTYKLDLGTMEPIRLSDLTWLGTVNSE
ncbi:MAG: hypothetical protein ACLFTK_04680 [Anaerolineales bacterium]